jgi:hypothetical protein
MTTLRHWEGPGAWVFHSEWWLREHWGRAFDVLTVQRPPRTSDGSPEIDHSFIGLRKRDVILSKTSLERIDPAELRELAGLQTNLRLARNEARTLAAGRAPKSGSLRDKLLATPMGALARRFHQRLRASVSAGARRLKARRAQRR